MKARLGCDAFLRFVMAIIGMVLTIGGAWLVDPRRFALLS